MIDMTLFHFLRPEWLIAIIPLIVLLVLVGRLHKQQSGWQSVLAGHLYHHLMTSKDGGRKRPPLLLVSIGWLLAVLALAGPTWEQLPQPVYQLNTGKVVVLDMSMSMRSTDIKPDRLTRAKFKAIDLINEISEGETGLVAYAGDAFTISPLSSDGQNLTTLVPSLTPEIMPIAGSEPYLGLASAIDLLKNAGFQQGEIFLITDGIEQDQLVEISELINDSPYRLSILGVGTDDGAPIQLANGELFKDSRGAIVIPRLQENLLKSLAGSGGGRYAPLQADDSDIDYLVDQALLDRDTQDQKESEDPTGDEWKEAGPYLALLLLPLAAYAFRRGLIAVLMLAFLLPAMTPPAHANWWDDLWKTADQQGMQSFTQGEFDNAAEQFNDPMWRGSAAYKAGDYESALEAFEKVDNPQGHYNRGNSLAQLGKLDEAIAAYDEVLNRNPEHEDAKANKALLEQQKEQQEQQQQQQQQDQQQDQQDQDQQSQDQQQQDQQQQDQQQQDQEQQNQQNSEDQQDSQQQPQESDSESESEQNQQDEQEQSEQEQKESEEPEQEQPMNAQEAENQELSDEEKEQLQRLQNLLRKVPDDPAYLLKRKMLLEHQQRKRERAPNQKQRNW